MNYKKFKNFLESLKGHGKDPLIESIKQGFKACFESIEDEADKDIEAYFDKKVPPDIQRLINQATTDLYTGPLEEEDYPGFQTASAKIQEWVDNELSEVWYDTQSGYVSEEKPKGYEDEDSGEWVEPFWEDYYHYDKKHVVQLVLGNELANTLYR